MMLEALISALALPASCRVDQRVPKKMLAENAAATAADKRNILDGIEEIQWIAALKPDNIGVAEFRDETRTYLELAVLSLVLRTGTRTARIAELVHRAIPYPVLLLISGDDGQVLSMAHIRQAQNEASNTVLDGQIVLATIPADHIGHSFLQAMALPRQPRDDLFALYQGWIDKILALEAAQLTGNFTPSAGREQATARHLALQQCRELDARIASLRSTASKEKQLARQVAINLEIKELTAQRARSTVNL
ncbi:hypothetical protein D9M73_51060 [compost metagenome]